MEFREFNPELVTYRSVNSRSSTPNKSRKRRNHTLFNGMKTMKHTKSKFKDLDENTATPSKKTSRGKGKLFRENHLFLGSSKLSSNIKSFFKEAIEKLKVENSQLKEKLEDAERRLKEKEVYIMKIMDEFNKKKDSQQKLYEDTIANLNSRIQEQTKFIGEC